MAEDSYGTPDAEVAIEQRRLAHLAAARDPSTFAVLERVGIAPGWTCLEVGAGRGTVSTWMAAQVGESGRVTSLDIDTQFHDEMPNTVTVVEADIVDADLPDAPYDLIHARALLQHIPQRREVLTRMVSLLRPGGWLVIEDGHFSMFGEQELPEPYATMHRIIASGAQNEWRDPSVGAKVLAWMRDEGLVELDARGEVWAMRPGEDGGEWWFLALERAGPALVGAGLISQDDYDTALAQVRSPDFVMLSSTSIATIGRRPAADGTGSPDARGAI